MRIDVGPNPALTVLRTLRRDAQPGVVGTPAPRVFRIGARRLLHDPPELFTLTPGGVPHRRVARIPKELAVKRVVGSRWLVLKSPELEVPNRLYTLDLLKSENRPRRLSGPWGNAESVDIAASDDHRIVVCYNPTYPRTEMVVVSLPSAHSVRLGASEGFTSPLLWGRWVVLETYPDDPEARSVITLFDTRSGREVAVLQIPRAVY